MSACLFCFTDINGLPFRYIKNGIFSLFQSHRFGRVFSSLFQTNFGCATGLWHTAPTPPRHINYTHLVCEQGSAALWSSFRCSADMCPSLHLVSLPCTRSPAVSNQSHTVPPLHPYVTCRLKQLSAANPGLLQTANSLNFCALPFPATFPQFVKLFRFSLHVF